MILFFGVRHQSSNVDSFKDMGIAPDGDSAIGENLGNDIGTMCGRSKLGLDPFDHNKHTVTNLIIIGMTAEIFTESGGVSAGLTSGSDRL